MPAERESTIALLGATGKTGRVVVRNLLADDHYVLNIYARSKEKLLQLFPDLERKAHVKLFIGSINDQKLIHDLLQGVDKIICTTGTDGLAPTTILRDTANAIVTALKQLKSEGKLPAPPRAVWLSSSSKNERFRAQRPPPINWLIVTAFQYGYIDLQDAIDILDANRSLVSTLYVQPGVLIDEEGTGYGVSVEAITMAVSYDDLGAGIIEVLTHESYDGLQQIGVSSKGGDRVLRYLPTILFRITRGLIAYFAPFELGVAFNAWLTKIIG